jgi:hypothetical protein
MAAVASTVCVTEATAAGSTGIQFGYPQLEPKFTIGRLIGKGGNGMVREVQLASDGRTFACKTIPKVSSSVASTALAAALQPACGSTMPRVWMEITR